MLKIDTKQILADSFCELTKTYPFDKISVQMIVKNCGASRTAFYNHFKDKYELIEWIYRHDSEAIYKECKKAEEKESFYVRLIYYMLEKRDYYLNISSYQGQNSIEDYITRYSALCEKAAISRRIEDKKIPEEVNMAIDIWSLARTDQTFKWLRTKPKVSPEKLADMIYNCRPTVLSEYYG